jgi:uncharacterized protein (TIGR02757 family)
VSILKAPSLKKTLDRFYREYDFHERTAHDPIMFPHRYKSHADKEISGFIAACFAYGRVELFGSVVEMLLSKMGASPYDFLLDFDPKKQEKAFKGIKYRFNENEDILCLFFVLHKILKKNSTVEKTFMKSFRDDDETVEKGVTGLVTELLQVDTSAVYGKNIKPPGLSQFLPLPAKGSACKRLNLFLRWMIRDRDIDFGIWKGVPKNKLIIPLDTHIARISRCLGFTERKTQDWQMAVEITRALKQFDPADPLKYDFALCHHGISGMCRGERKKDTCRECIFRR